MRRKIKDPVAMAERKKRRKQAIVINQKRAAEEAIVASKTKAIKETITSRQLLAVLKQRFISIIEEERIVVKKALNASNTDYNQRKEYTAIGKSIGLFHPSKSIQRIVDELLIGSEVDVVDYAGEIHPQFKPNLEEFVLFKKLLADPDVRKTDLIGLIAEKQHQSSEHLSTQLWTIIRQYRFA